MNSERIIELFSEAMTKPSPEERARFLAEACRDEPEVRDQVESLLRVEVRARAFLPEPSPSTGPAVVLDMEKVGDRIARYKLLEKIGEGGWGVVYRAEQEAPVRRHVALKVIKLGMDTKQVIARFEAERQALALMDHPNIAKVFDAGSTGPAESQSSNLKSELPHGRPYFVMELVRGIKITDYCDQNQLSTGGRLQLFVQVCQAIQHAHQKGIIHRDIKPSNILVTVNDGVAVPKVIDFGIAKATDQRLTDQSYFTGFQSFIGTPAYTSPEQAEMSSLDIDTRSDIYSLGVLLYELLTGQTPFGADQLQRSGLDEMRRIIREEEPVKPSTRLTQDLRSGASERESKIQNPKSKIPQDLDWVVMKCLEKDRARRYETATGLAADIQRHLQHEPVLARPASTAYRLGKLVRRNKLAFAAVSAVASVLVLGTAISTWQAFEASRARDAEKQERRRAERGELVARQKAYASDMNLAQQAIAQNNLGRAQELLNRHRPAADSLGSSRPVLRSSTTEDGSAATDLRGWEWRYLWRQCQGEERFILGEHVNGATAVGVLADGKTAFSAGRDKLVRLWDLESRRPTGLLLHSEEVIGTAASPDGRWLATATMKGPVGQPLLLWDLATQKIAATLTTEFWLRPGSLTFSPNNQWLAFATIFGGIRLWDVNARLEITNLSASGTSIGSIGLAFAPDNRTLAYNENEYGAILLWDVASQSVTRRLTGHRGVVTALAFSPDGQALSSASDDRTARIWNLAEQREPLAFTNSDGGFTALAFSPNGQTLAISGGGGAGRIIRLVDVQTGIQKAERRGHHKDITSVTFTPDGQSLLSASNDGTIRVWDMVPRPKENTGYSLASDLRTDWSTYGPALSLSPDARYLLAVYTNQTFNIWDTLRFAEGERHPLPFTNTLFATVAPKGKLAAFANWRGEVMLWEDETGHARFFARPGTNRVHRLVFSPDGRYLATADDTKTLSQMTATLRDSRRVVRVWDVRSRKETHVLPTDGELVMSLTFSADAKVLMAGFWLGSVKLWPLDRSGEGDTFLGHADQVGGLALRPDGQTLLSSAQQIRIWDVRTRRETGKLNARAGGFCGLALSPDGLRFAAGGSDGRITIGDIASHQEVAILEGHRESVMHLAFTPDGDHLVSVSKDQLRVWRAPSWAEIEAVETTARK